jgi:hypothetical protein
LGLPIRSGKLEGEVVRLLLEAHYGPTLSGRSHGFRPAGPPHAQRDVANTWTGATWFIDGDLADCFGTFDHSVMLQVLGEKIHRILRLLRNMCQAGYLEDWVWGGDLCGVPQGAVLAPPTQWITRAQKGVVAHGDAVPDDDAFAPDEDFFDHAG